MSEQKPVKATKLVVRAIKHLNSETGFTPKEIINYIQANYDSSSRTVKSVYTALKRGEGYGILRAERGKYALTATGTLSRILYKKHTDNDFDDPNHKGLCKPRKSRRQSRRGKSRGCKCSKRRSGSRRRRSRRGGRCKKRGSRRRSHRRRSGKRSCSCGRGGKGRRRRRGGKSRRRRGGRRSGRKGCGGSRTRGGRRGGRRRRRSRRGGSRSRRPKCGC